MAEPQMARESQTVPLPRTAGSMIDLLAIYDLVARFDDAVNRRDKDEFRTLWAEDGVWEIGPPRELSLQGADRITDIWYKMTMSAEWMFRGSFAGVVTLDGSTGHGRWPCIETGNLGVKANGPPPGYDNRAIYEDLYIKTDDIWLFKKRHYVYLWLSTNELPGAPVKLTEPGPQG